MDEIYHKYADTVYRYLYSKTRDASLSEELTQETFCQAIRTADRFDGSSNVTTWLCGIASNVLRTYWRRHPYEPEVSERDSVGGSVEEELLDGMYRVELMRLLHAMEDPGREVLYLRIFGDLSFREIGEVFSKTENWARVTYYRAKEKLRKEAEKL